MRKEARVSKDTTFTSARTLLSILRLSTALVRSSTKQIPGTLCSILLVSKLAVQYFYTLFSMNQVLSLQLHLK